MSKHPHYMGYTAPRGHMKIRRAHVGDFVTVHPPVGPRSGQIIDCGRADSGGHWLTLRQIDGAQIQVIGSYFVEIKSLLEVMAEAACD